MKIVLVDGQTLIRKGIISILSLQDTVEVAIEAKNKQEALHVIQREKPDLTIVNLDLGNECGLDLIEEARQLGCTCKFVILTYSKDITSFKRAKALMIDGYISVNAHPDELIYALQVIKKGRKFYDPDIIDLLLQSKRKPQMNSIFVEHLTSKEKEVLEELGMGKSNKQIAEVLYITENTVKKHVSQILSKLNLVDRTQAALYANEMGLAQFRYTEDEYQAL